MDAEEVEEPRRRWGVGGWMDCHPPFSENAPPFPPPPPELRGTTLVSPSLLSFLFLVPFPDGGGKRQLQLRGRCVGMGWQWHPLKDGVGMREEEEERVNEQDSLFLDFQP